jgi:hypothetical protein
MTAVGLRPNVFIDVVRSLTLACETSELRDYEVHGSHVKVPPRLRPYEDRAKKTMYLKTAKDESQLTICSSTAGYAWY